MHEWEVDGEAMERWEELNDVADTLCAMLTGLHLDGCLSGKQTSLLALGATKAGVQSWQLASTGLHPGAPVPHHQRRMDAALSLNIVMTEALYTYNTPSFDQVDCCRAVRGMSVLPPHEVMHKDFLSDRGQRARLEDAVLAVGAKLPRARSCSQLGCEHGASRGTPWHCTSMACLLPDGME